MRQTSLLNPEHLVALLAGPVFYTSTDYMDFVDIFNVSLHLSTVLFSVFWSQVEHKIVLFYSMTSVS